MRANRSCTSVGAINALFSKIEKLTKLSYNFFTQSTLGQLNKYYARVTVFFASTHVFKYLKE